MSVQNTISVRYFFTETSVRKEDVTCVHDAFKQLDPEKLLNVLLENQLAWKLDPRMLRGRAKDHLLQKTASMLQLMYQIDPVPLPSPNLVIIPVQSFQYLGRRNALKREIRASILDLANVSMSDQGSLDYAKTISQLLAHLSHNEGDPPYIRRIDSLISVPWSQVLGYALWLPISLTEYERYAELAHLFWVMSYSGYAEAVFEMKESVLYPSPDLEEATEKMNVFYEEQEIKMARICELLSFNAMVDAHACALSLKEAA